MKTNSLVVSLIGLVLCVFVVSCGANPTTSPPLTSTLIATVALPYKTIGPFCNIPVEGKQESNVDPNLYLRIFSGLSQIDDRIINENSPSPGNPEFRLDRFDFTENILLLVEWGSHNNCGPLVYVRDVKMTSKMVEVKIEKVVPGPDAIQQPAGSSAFTFVSIPRSEIDTGKSVTFALLDKNGIILTRTAQLE